MMSPGECLVVPPNPQLVYLGEGAANIVYNIVIQPGTPPPSSIEEYHEGDLVPSDEELPELPEDPFDNRLLRLRKDLPTTIPCAIAQRDWLEHLRPLFEKHQIIDQRLVQIRDAEIVKCLNKELRDWEFSHLAKGPLRDQTGSRSRKRFGVFLADDEHGLLVTAMTPGDHDSGVMEFKPKWLAQSPSAPKTALRCRQCARDARKNAQLAAKGKSLAKIACVLDLVSEDPKEIIAACRVFLDCGSPLAPPPSDLEVQQFSHWLMEDNLLKKLQYYQSLYDKDGPLAADVESVQFRAAMTLRDCSVFIRWPKDPSHKVEARVGDLDLKSPEKKKYWQDTERDLIDEGWYDGTEPPKDWQSLNCHLNPKRYEPNQGRPSPTTV